jgi:antitoxin VapB
MKRSGTRKTEHNRAERESADTEVARAKLFWNGRSQAVRLPRAFRFEGDEVSVRREGDAVILEPVRKRDWPPEYWDRLRELTRDFEFPEVEPLGGGLLDVRLDDV